MKFRPYLIALMLVSAVLAGCASKSPYDYMENWVIREDALRTFVVPADVIYLQSDLYTNLHHVTVMQVYADDQVGKGKFKRIARVFSPLVANAQDLELAMKWYFKHHHDDGRPFVFIGEGVGGALLHNYEIKEREDLLKEGLVASYYSDVPQDGFVTDKMVEEIRAAVYASRYKSIWDRDMPEGMVDK